MSVSVLVVDDNRSAAEALGLVLQRQQYRVEVCFDGTTAIARLDQGGVDVVITDLRMEGVDGIDVLRHARRLARPAEVVVLTGYGTVEAAVTAMRLGARDFLTKPVTPSQVVALLKQLEGDGPGVRVMEGPSSTAARLRRQVDAVASSHAPVVLLGEPGTGRAEIARVLHERGPQSQLAFVSIGTPRALLELESRSVGTVFLPNLDLTDARDHADFVRALEALAEHTRVVASAGPDWSDRQMQGVASRELYFRVAVLQLHLPPLRERPEDIGPLIEARLRDRLREGQLPYPDAQQLEALGKHAWPGNLRELTALVERALVFGPSAWDIPVRPHPAAATTPPLIVEGFSLQDYLEQVERSILEQAIQQTGMDRNEMSRLLNVERNTLRYKLNKYGLLDR